ncbi:MAG TPA: TIGR00730 family Rossman fold protein [Caulobacteraceae bacterium]|jgi:uncharacterized protein (TIGR00730 family)
MRAIGVYCASTSGSSALFQDAAREAGTALARLGIELVYGGGRFGLMGLVADAALAAGGKVTGVMTRGLVEREIAHPGLSAIQVVETMHERKAAMETLADGFIALPGGPGTMEEIFEQWTCGILGLHAKPCGFLDVGGYFDPLRAMIDKMSEAGFLRPDHAAMLAFAPDVDSLVTRFEAYVPPALKYVQDGPASTPAP